MHKAKELIFFGDDLPAAEAERIGIVNKVVPAAELGAATKEWAERLASGPTKAIGWAKKLLQDASELSRRDLLDEEAMLVEMNSSTQDSGEGMASFRERRDTGVEGLVSAQLVKDRTAVVGIGQTTLGKGLPDTELSLACQAVSLALDDAGIARVGGRRARVVHVGAQPRGRRRPRGRARRHHVLLAGRASAVARAAV